MAYHINPKSGSVGKCRAEEGNCPFGPVEDHYDSPASARLAFEKKMSANPLDRSTLKSLTADELRSVLVKEAGEIGLDTKKVAKAALFAKELHRGQFRSAPPWEERPAYITHPLRNAIRLIRWGCKEPNVILAGILHDTVEDCADKYCDDRGIKYSSPEEAREILLAKIRKDYGKRVAELVLKLSNPYQSDEERALMTIEQKNNDYTAHVAEAIKGDSDVLLAKLSDFHDNAASLIHSNYPGRERQTKKQAVKYMQTMPVFRAELARNPLKNPVLRKSTFDSIILIEDRLRDILKP